MLMKMTWQIFDEHCLNVFFFFTISDVIIKKQYLLIRIRYLIQHLKKRVKVVSPL